MFKDNQDSLNFIYIREFSWVKNTLNLPSTAKSPHNSGMSKKQPLLLFTILLITACDPYGFGYKKNPAYVLNETLTAISNLDQETFLEVTGKEVLCVYGNPAGLSYLKDKLLINPEDIKLTPTLLKSEQLKSPKFVGYWSYFHERYQIDIHKKSTNQLLLKAYVDCEYGTETEKDENLVGLPPKKYKKKECRLIKVDPTIFTVLPIPDKCSVLKVNL